MMERKAQTRTVPGTLRFAGARWRKALKPLVLYALAVILGAMFMFPFFWTVSGSLKSPWEMYAFPPLLFPAHPQWGNYYEALITHPFGRWFWNTLQVVVLNTLGLLVSSSLVAYGFARFDFRFKGFLFMVTLSSMMLPAQVSLIPRFILFYKLHWLDTLKPLWVPAWFGGSAFAIFLLRQFIMTLPMELDEAAIIDGASHFRVFWNILVPLCKPALATLAIIVAIQNWDSFMEPLVYLNNPEKFTVAIGLRYFHIEPMAGDKPMGHLLMAASVSTILPPMAVFFSFQRYFVRGIALSGLKE